jgi:predicted phage baseplate assembly protein
MAMPEILLDNRSFEDIVRDARARIPTYTPEWTDYNESDPGITLLELFAWLTEMILYRLNQVPEKNYRKFLDLIGVTLKPPVAATAELTFTLTAKDLTATVPVEQRTQVALAAPVDGVPVVFETDVDLNAVGSSIVVVQSFDGGLFKLISDADHPAGDSFAPFGPRPQEEAALYVGLDRPFPAGAQSLRLRVHVDTQGLITEGQGLAVGDTAAPPPPVVAYWEYWAGDRSQWQRLKVTSDTTGSFVRTGDIIFDAPTNFVARKVGLKQRDSDPALFWLRFRIESVLGPGYETTPLLQDLLLNTVTATNAVTVTDELLGAADGSPGQKFTLAKVPVLPDTLTLQVDEGNGFVTWKRVEDFAGSARTDLHYTVDPATGIVQFGGGEHGKIPLPYPVTTLPGVSQDLTDPRPVANVKAAAYRWGGGARGNAGTNTITALKFTVPYVASVTNLRPSVGGADQESVDAAKQRAPGEIRSGARAVTADDFETVALQTPAAMIARAEALPLHNPLVAPMRPSGAGLDPSPVPVPGVVTVIVVPSSRDVKPLPTSDTLRLVGDYLGKRCPVTTQLFVIAPKYRKVQVQAKLALAANFVGESPVAAVNKKLLAFFHPLTGGLQGTGWPFGEPVSVPEVYRQILSTDGVDRIVAGSLTVFVDGKPASEVQDVTLAADEIVYSERHTIT